MNYQIIKEIINDPNVSKEFKDNIFNNFTPEEQTEYVNRAMGIIANDYGVIL